MKYSIERENPKQYREVENIVREAFWNVYRPGCLEHYLLHVLRGSDDFVKELDYVLKVDDKIIGQNVFVKANIKCDNGQDLPVLTMGPICIAPEYRRQGYGKILLDYTLNEATRLGFCAVLIEGDIDFYGKSGFTYAREYGIRYAGLPDGMDDSFFLCKQLKEGYLNGITGEYATPEVYMVDERDVDEFDKKFAQKVKLNLPGQLC